MSRAAVVAFIYKALLLAGAGQAQERPVHWAAAAPTGHVVAGGTFDVTVTARIDSGWKLYSFTQPPGGPTRTRITVAVGRFRAAGAIKAPAPEKNPDRNFNLFTEIYTDSVTVRVPLMATPAVAPGTDTAALAVEFQTCTERYCLPPRTDTVRVAVIIDATNRSVAIGRSSEIPVAAPTMPDSVARASGAVQIVGTTGGLLPFLWSAIAMGFVSLLTPCVLPLIPVTVAWFHRGGAGPFPRGRRVRVAVAHAGGIATGFVALGLGVSIFFGATGLVQLAANPWLNIAIALMFAAIALSLLGLLNVTLPRFLIERLTATADSGPRAFPAAVIGAGFAVSSFTCIAPFVGTLLVLATQGDWRWPVLGLTAYAAAFATPFLVFALAPGLLVALPKPGAWMLTLKASLASIELALAVKFLANADVVMHWNVVTRVPVVAAWIAALVAVALLVAGLLRPRHAEAIDLNWRRAALALVPLAAASWLVTGLFGRPLGELEAYLPVPTAASQGRDDLPWLMNDFEAGLSRARAQQQFVFVDFTGYTCTNCRWMEANMFTRPEVRQLLERYVRVRLFTDGRGEPYRRQQALQLQRFATVALPYYAILDPAGRPVATYLGMTRDADEFTRFLRAPFGK